MSMYQTPGMYIAMKGEGSTFRNSDTALTDTNLFVPDDCETDLTPPEPPMDKEDKRVLGSGRNVAKVMEMGYSLGDESLEFYFQSGIFLNYCLGTCQTVAIRKINSTDDYANEFEVAAKVDVVSDGADTRVVYLAGIDANGIICVDELTLTSDTPVESTTTFAADGLYCIYTTIKSATRTISVNEVDGTTYTYLSILPNAVESAGTSGYYFHDIRESNTLGSFGLHCEWENDTDAESIRKDMLGCMVKSIEIPVEMKAKVKQNVGITSAYSVAGTDITKPTGTTVSGKEHIGWDHLTVIDLKYNSVAVMSSIKDHISSIAPNITNEYTVDHAMGDPYPKKQHIGIREYKIAMSYYPTNDTLYTLYRTELASYAGALALILGFNRSTYDIIQINFSHLRVNAHPNILKVISENMDELVECELVAAPSNVCKIFVVDSIGDNYYTSDRYTTS